MCQDYVHLLTIPLTSFHKSQYSAQYHVIFYLVQNIKISQQRNCFYTDLCKSFYIFFPVVLEYLWWSCCLGKHTIPSVIFIKHADFL